MCGEQVPQNVAAHLCPHDEPCRFRLRDDGSVFDWETPHCDQCEKAAARPKLALSPKALSLFASEEPDSDKLFA